MKATRVMWVAVLVLSAGLNTGCSRMRRVFKGDSLSETLATVSGRPITRGDFLTIAAQRYGQDLMQALVMENEVKAMADADHVTMDDQQYQQNDSRLKARYTDPGRLAFEERQLRTNLLLQAVALKDIPETLRHKFYDDFQKQLVSYEMSQILVQDPEVAKQVESEVRQGSDFAALASQLSTDTATKENGGYLGEFTAGEIRRGYGGAARIILALKPGERPEPIRSQLGYHVFKVLSVKSTYDELKSTIERRLADSRQGELMEQMRTSVGAVTAEPIITPTPGSLSPAPAAASATAPETVPSTAGSAPDASSASASTTEKGQ